MSSERWNWSKFLLAYFSSSFSFPLVRCIIEKPSASCREWGEWWGVWGMAVCGHGVGGGEEKVFCFVSISLSPPSLSLSVFLPPDCPPSVLASIRLPSTQLIRRSVSQTTLFPVDFFLVPVCPTCVTVSCQTDLNFSPRSLLVCFIRQTKLGFSIYTFPICTVSAVRQTWTS